jgi:hypothetical protein
MKPMRVSAMHCAIAAGDSEQVTTQRLEHVGAARLAGNAAVAVLADARAGRCGDEHAAGRDVEGVRAVAAGADDVDEVRLSCTSTLVENSRITCAAAVISPIVSFLTRRPMSSAAVIAGDISPLMMRRIRSSISSWKISRCSMVRVSASVSRSAWPFLLSRR